MPNNTTTPQLVPSLDFATARKNGFGGWTVTARDGHIYASESTTSPEPPPDVDGPEAHSYFHVVAVCGECAKAKTNRGWR